MADAQSLREQRFARALDREVAPVWHDRFARLVFRHLPEIENPFVLDVQCGAGRTTYELLDRLGPATRVLGLESDATMRGMAKARMETAWKDRVYFRSGDVTDIADMAEDTYDLLVANLVLTAGHDATKVLEELVRVVKPGGRVLVTLPMTGTWAEVEDLFQLVLMDAGRQDAARRLRRLGRMRKSGPELARIATEIGLNPRNVVIEHERFDLLFNSGREFLFTPMVEHGPLRSWKAILGDETKQKELFWQLKEAIDAYYAETVFAVSIVAGVVAISVPGKGVDAESMAGHYWSRYPELDGVFGKAERGELGAEEEDVDLDIDLDDESEADEEVAEESPVEAAQSLNAEDAAIFALLDESKAPPENDTELDTLLDQVLEFANTPDAQTAEAHELEPEELAAILPPEDVRTKPGDTLSRIKALLPPPPSGSHPVVDADIIDDADILQDLETRPRPAAPGGKPPRRLPPPPPPPRKKKK